MEKKLLEPLVEMANGCDAEICISLMFRNIILEMFNLM